MSKKGKSIYLSQKQISMIKSALNSKMDVLHESYESKKDESDFDWLIEYRNLLNDKFEE